MHRGYLNIRDRFGRGWPPKGGGSDQNRKITHFRRPRRQKCWKICLFRLKTLIFHDFGGFGRTVTQIGKIWQTRKMTQPQVTPPPSNRSLLIIYSLIIFCETISNYLFFCLDNTFLFLLLNSRLTLPSAKLT